MAIGDNADMAARLRRLLPPWFGESNPLVDALVAAAAVVLAFAYSLFAYAKAQTRIRTATGIWLDIIAQDFYGLGLLRAINESDDAYRVRIIAGLFRPKATREAIAEVVESLTGEAPTIIEPFSPKDCGAYDKGYAGYGVAGAYGSMLTPAQAFLITSRPVLPAVAYIGGWHKGPWGYGVGKGAYTSLVSIIPDSAIYAAIAATKAEGVRIWVAFSGYSGAHYLETEGSDILATEGGQILTI